jgi:CubicO group peptidase (beta-lactamase class C family)
MTIKNMKYLIFNFSLFLFCGNISAQNLYFPPVIGNNWETITPASLGWCEDKIPALYTLLENENTKAFIVLKDGKIVLEKYFGTFQQDSLWYWASAGKSVTSLLVGIAQKDGLLSINDKTSDYLNTGWSSLTPDKEALITIKNQLSMTSGLEDAVPDHTCTLPSCLLYKADAGTRWAYHNGPYTLLDGVIEAATGSTLNAYFNQKLRTKIGMNGGFFKIDYNNVLISSPRSMARYGLLILNKGKWNNTPVLNDAAYFDAMTNSSQSINPSYGYLWWLNGKSTFMIPQTQVVFPGSLCPDAPTDMVSALGKNGQIINVVPSQNLVVIRMGNAPDNSLVPFTINNQIWQLLNPIMCNASAVVSIDKPLTIKAFPNPTQDYLHIEAPINSEISMLDILGRNIEINYEKELISMKHLSAGIYFLKVKMGDKMKVLKVEKM